jgi:DNA-binding protein H-NS
MSFHRLTALRDEVDAVIQSKRCELEAELGRLSRLEKAKDRSPVVTRSAIAPKYRNPEDKNETWAGRGLRPKWFIAAIKRGYKVEELLVGSPPTRAKKKKLKQKRKSKASISRRTDPVHESAMAMPEASPPKTEERQPIDMAFVTSASDAVVPSAQA